MGGSVSRRRNGSLSLRRQQSNQQFRPLVPALVRELTASYGALATAAEKALADNLYTKAKLEEDYKRAQSVATSGVPPIEKSVVPTLDGPGEPLDAERIFSICWKAFYDQSATGTEDSHKLSSRHGDGLLEGLDGAEALRAWKAET